MSCNICSKITSSTQGHVFVSGECECGASIAAGDTGVSQMSPNPTLDVDKIEIEGFVTVKPPIKTGGDDNDDSESNND